MLDLSPALQHVADLSAALNRHSAALERVAAELAGASKAAARMIEAAQTTDADDTSTTSNAAPAQTGVSETPPTSPGLSAGGQAAEPGTATGESTDAPQTDSRGIRWDGRVHSSSRALNADGTWRKRNGVSNETREKVEAEQKAAVPAAATAPPATDPGAELNGEAPTPAPAPETSPSLPASVTTPAPKPAEGGLDVEAVRAELMEVVAAKGPEPVRAIVAEYAPELLQVDPAKLPELRERVLALMKPAPAPAANSSPISL